MATNQGDKASTSLEGLGYAYDKVLFEPASPILAKELNLAQELQETLTQKSTAHLPSGWLSYRPIYTSIDLQNSFYTQDPIGAKPEVALVNGWPVYVTNTETPLRHVNKIQFNDAELRAGSRVDGVFLEVWRAVIAPQLPDSTKVISNSSAKPRPITQMSNINGITMYNEDLGWAVGENGTILKTVDGGIKWNTVNTPININFKKIKFSDINTGFAIADKGQIVKTLDSGESWFSLTTPTTDNLNDIFVINEVNVCVVGNNGIILLSTDGVNFNIVSQTTNNVSNLNSVWFNDTSVGWTVGDKGSLLMTLNGGHAWQKYVIYDSNTREAISEKLSSVAFYNLNDGIIVGENGKIFRSSDSGFSWANMSNRIWYNGEYKSITEIFPTSTINFNKVFIQSEFPIRFTIAVYSDSRNFFKNLIYKISPSTHPNSLVLEYTGAQDNVNYVNVLDLDAYSTADALRDAINQILSPYRVEDVSLPDSERQKVRVFDAVINYEAFSKPSDFRPSSGSFSGITPAQISFSVEDRAWIAADNGLALISSNSGSKWVIKDLGVSNKLNDVFFVSDNKGWFVGTEGTIVKNDDSLFTTTEIQSTDLISKIKGRIYPEGNILSQATDYLTDDIIDPQLGVETTKRVQIQYRIRVVFGVDSSNYPEAGLGGSYVYSTGPNDNTGDAGNYPFVNMGEENGDYGLWRARCRGTYDGFSWAVPMFFVTRKNSSAFSVDNNINGSSYFDSGAIRPDGLTYEQIVQDDISDIRRQINIQSYSYFLEKNLENLLSNNLKTNVSSKEQNGLQYGSTLFIGDKYSGVTDINNLVQGGVSSAAIIIQDQKILDPNTALTTSEMTFGPHENGIFHNEKAYYSSYVARNGVTTSEPVAGTWEGLGTPVVVFNIAENFKPVGGTLTGVTYVFTANYIYYGNPGLSRVPQYPVAVKYQSNPANPSSSFYFNGINTREDYRILEKFEEMLPGYPDFVNIYSAKKIPVVKADQDLYEVIGHKASSDTDYQRSLRKYEAQQFRGTLVEYHYFVKTTSATTMLRIPKNLNGYSIFGVKSITNVEGASYKIATNYQANASMRDRETVENVIQKGNLLVYVDEAFTIPANATLEIILEAISSPSTFGYTGLDLGLTVTNTGETQEALRSPFTANFEIASKAIGGMYIGILYPITLPASTITIDMTNPGTGLVELTNATIMGISSCVVKDNNYQMYGWYLSNNIAENYYTLAPIASVTGFGTTSVVINFDPRKTIVSGTVLIPMILKMNSLPSLGVESVATAFYHYVPYQTINNLPDKLNLEIVKSSDFVYISNLGTGASDLIKGEPYAVPIEHIAVNDDSIPNDNIFSNVDDLDFSDFSIDTGFIKMPAIISQYVGEDIELSNPINIGDKLGRTFYKTSSKDIYSQAQNLTVGAVRKVFIPMIGRVRTDVLSPILRGELVLVIYSKVYKARIENKTGYYEDNNVEYSPGYTEDAETAISIYRLINRPLVRK